MYEVLNYWVMIVHYVFDCLLQILVLVREDELGTEEFVFVQRSLFLQIQEIGFKKGGNHVGVMPLGMDA